MTADSGVTVTLAGSTTLNGATLSGQGSFITNNSLTLHGSNEFDTHLTIASNIGYTTTQFTVGPAGTLDFVGSLFILPDFNNQGTVRADADLVFTGASDVDSGTFDTGGHSIQFAGCATFNTGTVFTGSGPIQFAGTNTITDATISARSRFSPGRSRSTPT